MNQHVAHRRSDEIHELRAEIERLREEDKLREAAFKAYAKQERKDRDKIERLQAALALSQSQNYCTLCGAILGGTSGEHVATSDNRSNK